MKTALVVSLITLTVMSCAQDADRVLLSQFFAASRLRDLTALHKFSTVVFEPTSDGIVTRFAITGVTDHANSKEVLITAPVRLPDGREVLKDFAITVQGGLVTAFIERPRPSAASTPPR